MPTKPEDGHRSRPLIPQGSSPPSSDAPRPKRSGTRLPLDESSRQRPRHSPTTKSRPLILNASQHEAAGVRWIRRASEQHDLTCLNQFFDVVLHYQPASFGECARLQQAKLKFLQSLSEFILHDKHLA